MRHFRTRALALTSALVLCFAAFTAAAETRATVVQTVPNIEFTVSMPQPHTHLLEVEMRVRNASTPAQTDLVMPVWTPGSYLVREFARHVQDFEAKGAAGRALAWSKVNKNTWRVETGGQRDWRATYRVYANELTVRTSELNDRHAFWNNTALLMHIDGQLGVPSTLRVVPFKDWKVATGLQPLAGERNTFIAPNFDVLYDSPVIASDFKTLSFEVRGTPHRIIIDGDQAGSNIDPERLRRDTQKVVEATIALMGDVPYRDYTFILLLRPGGGGGLEHLNSTALIANPFGFRSEASYVNFLSLVAHEFFHLWNVKRIRPDALGPFDYTKENYTRLLWVAEGLTSYYEDILLRRAGLISDKEALERMARNIQGVQNVPGRLAMSVEEASFDAWIKYYRQDENSINSQISYYDKGNVVGLLLDLRIRALSNGARSLDDVMRYLYTEHAKRGRNFSPADFQRAAEIAAGQSMDDFFSRYVRGRDELDYNAALATAGLRLDTTGAPPDAAKPAPQRTHLGATLVQDGDRLIVRNVPAGTPAYEQGLNANDQIIAIDGVRASLSFLNARLDEKRPGDTVSLSVFRFDELRNFSVKLAGRVEAPYRIVPVANPSDEQKKIYQSWLGAAFPASPVMRAATTGASN